MSVSADDCEPCGVYRDGWRKARKEHTCSACSSTIRPRDRYFYIYAVNSEGAWHCKRCARCEAIHAHLAKILPYDEFPDHELDCGHDYEAVHGVPPPPEIAELAFLTPDEMQKRLPAP